MITAIALLAAVLIGAAAPAARTPVLVELFTSEGCSSCPPADVLLARLIESQPVAGAEVIGIEEHVDYWNRLGWKDPFSSAAFSRRQEDYATIFGPDRVYTPQMIVGGTDEFVGSDAKAASAAIEAAAARPHLGMGLQADLRGDTVRIAVDAPPAPADANEAIDVIVALVEDGLTSAVTRGENTGRTLRHMGVARRLQSIGALDRDAFSGEGQWKLAPAWQREQTRVVAFLQGRRTHRVYGASQARLSSR